MNETPGMREALKCVEAELRYTFDKFPGRKHVHAALIEEVGELANALLEHSREKCRAVHIFEEAVQVAAMAVRIAIDGSEEFPYRYADGNAKLFWKNRRGYERSEAIKTHKLASGAYLHQSLDWPYGYWYEDGVSNLHYGSEEAAARAANRGKDKA